MYGPNHLVVQLFGSVETSLCIGTQPFSFSIAWGSGILDIYGPKHLVYQLFGRGVGKWDIHEYIQTFSFSFFSGSVNLDMYGIKHSVFQLSRGV